MNPIFEHFIVSAMLSFGSFPDSFTVREMACLNEAVYFEAGSESQRGKEAVAHAIINRVRTEGFPGDICQVIRQKGQFGYRSRGLKTFRFNPKNETLVKQLEDSAQASLRAALGSMDPTRGATHFVNPRIATDVAWLSQMKKVVAIGNHAFYKPKKGPPSYVVSTNPLRDRQSYLLAGGPIRPSSSPTPSLRQAD